MNDRGIENICMSDISFSMKKSFEFMKRILTTNEEKILQIFIKTCKI